MDIKTSLFVPLNTNEDKIQMKKKYMWIWLKRIFQQKNIALSYRPDRSYCIQSEKYPQKWLILLCFYGFVTAHAKQPNTKPWDKFIFLSQKLNYSNQTMFENL